MPVPEKARFSRYGITAEHPRAEAGIAGSSHSRSLVKQSHPVATRLASLPQAGTIPRFSALSLASSKVLGGVEEEEPIEPDFPLSPEENGERVLFFT
jgi:hypothetical protein